MTKAKDLFERAYDPGTYARAWDDFLTKADSLVTLTFFSSPEAMVALMRASLTDLKARRQLVALSGLFASFDEGEDALCLCCETRLGKKQLPKTVALILLEDETAPCLALALCPTCSAGPRAEVEVRCMTAIQEILPGSRLVTAAQTPAVTGHG